MTRKETEGTAAAEQPRTVVYLGNRNTIQMIGGERVPVSGKQCTTVILRPDASLMEAAQEITSAQGVWAAHSDGSPAWVASTEPALASLLAAHFKCEIREPETAEEA